MHASTCVLFFVHAGAQNHVHVPMLLRLQLLEQVETMDVRNTSEFEMRFMSSLLRSGQRRKKQKMVCYCFLQPCCSPCGWGIGAVWTLLILLGGGLHSCMFGVLFRHPITRNVSFGGVDISAVFLFAEGAPPCGPNHLGTRSSPGTDGGVCCCPFGLCCGIP